MRFRKLFKMWCPLGQPNSLESLSKRLQLDPAYVKEKLVELKREGYSLEDPVTRIKDLYEKEQEECRNDVAKKAILNGIDLATAEKQSLDTAEYRKQKERNKPVKHRSKLWHYLT